MKNNKFRETDKAIISNFVGLINDQLVNKTFHNGQEMIDQMYANKQAIIKNSNMKKDIKLMNAPDVLFYQIAIAFRRSNVIATNKDIARYVYNNIVITGLHACPDVCYPKVEKLLNQLYPNQ